MLKFSVQGIETIQEDLDAVMARVNKATTAGLKSVASDLTAKLQEHIQHDVYDAYKPRVYRRRYHNGGMIFGGNMDYRIQNNVLNFFYNWDTPTETYEDGTSWNWYENSDDAIRAIQQGYDFPTADPIGNPVRPFWANFLTEAIEGGVIERSFVGGFNTAAPDIRATVDGGVKRETTDNTYLDKPKGTII